MHSIASPSPGRSGHVTDLQLLTAVSSLTLGCDLHVARSVADGRRFQQEVFSIEKQDKQAWGGRAFEMVTHSTVDVHTRAAVVCTSRP